MKNALAGALRSARRLPRSPAAAQQAAITQTIAGTRLDINATGEVTRVPDVAVISAGVVSRAPTATGRAPGHRDQDAAGSRRAEAGRDRRSRHPDQQRQPQPRISLSGNQSPQLTGYTASNQLTVRFRDIRSSGRSSMRWSRRAPTRSAAQPGLDKPEAALDEARAKAIAIGRARAELYARSLGMRVVRIVAVSESGGNYAPPRRRRSPMMMARAEGADQDRSGRAKAQVNVAMTFELQ